MSTAIVKRKQPTAEVDSSKKPKTTEIEDSFLQELKAKAQATQNLITCTLCMEVARYPVYAACKIHMFCFHCMFNHVTRSGNYKFRADLKHLNPMSMCCPQCRREESDTPLDLIEKFVPPAVYEPLLAIS